MDEDLISVKAVKPFRNAHNTFGKSSKSQFRPRGEVFEPLTTKIAVKFLLEGSLKYKVCRYCLNVAFQLSELDEIFEVARKGAIYKVTLRDMIASVHPIKVAEDPNFPNKVCPQCVESAISSYMFAQQCERAERALRNCFDDIYTKFEKLDPLERPKKRGRQKINPNYNVLYTEHENVVDYAEPIINIINAGSTSLEDEQTISPLECPKCWQILPDIEALLNHESMHPKSMWFSCRLCGQSFVTQRLYKRHIKDVHKHGYIVTEPVIQNFRCNECGFVSSNFGEHLQHLEKHKFRTTFEHLMDRNMDQLCAVCLEKGTRMLNLNETIDMCGGYPGLNNEQSIQSIVTATFPERKSYKYQELLIPTRASIMTITKRMDLSQMKTSTAIYIDKRMFHFCAPIILSTLQMEFETLYLFIFSEPYQLHLGLSFKITENSLPTHSEDTKNLATGDDHLVGKTIFQETVTMEESVSANDNYGDDDKSNDDDPNDIVKSNDDDNDDPQPIELCKICWIFNKPSCKKCLSQHHHTDNNNLEDVMTEVVSVNKEQKNCQYCWLFETVGKCNYCKKILTEHNKSQSIDTNEMNNEQNIRKKDVDVVKSSLSHEDDVNRTSKALESKINTRKRKSTLELFVSRKLKWQCRICLTNNDKDRQTCFCCDFDTCLLDSKVKFNFGTNKHLFETNLRKDGLKVQETRNTVGEAKVNDLNNSKIDEKLPTEIPLDQYCIKKTNSSIEDDPMDIETTNELNDSIIENSCNNKFNPFIKDESMDVVYEGETAFNQPHNIPTAMIFHTADTINASVQNTVTNIPFMAQNMSYQFAIGNGATDVNSAKLKNRKTLRPVRRMANLGRK